jgi:ABC-type multidrug transport system fused ATPase/permease subunit
MYPCAMNVYIIRFEQRWLAMLKVYKFLFPYFLRHKFSLLQYFLYLNVCAAFEFATPLLLGYFIDGLLTFISLRSIVYFVVAFIAFQLVHILFRYLCTIKNALIQTQISLAVNSDTRKYIQELPLSYFNNKDLLYLSNRVDADSGVLASNAVFLLQTSWTVAAIFSLSLLYIIRVQPVLVVIVALMLVFYLVTFFIMRKKMYAHGYRHREVHSKLYSTLSEQILHYMIIKMFNLYKYYFNKFLSVSQVTCDIVCKSGSLI